MARSQGDAAESVIYLKEGGVKLSVVNEGGKEAIIALLAPGDFFGEGCMAGRPVRMGTASTVAPSTVLVIDKTVTLCFATYRKKPWRR